MLLKGGKSFREKRSEFRHKVVDSIYDMVPPTVVEHLGNANKEVVFAVEGVLDGIVKRIDKRVDAAKSRKSGSNGSAGVEGEEKGKNAGSGE